MDYLGHYTKLPDLPLFFLLSLVLLLLIYLILWPIAIKRGKAAAPDKKGQIEASNLELNLLTERFIELIYSGTSILFFMASYYLTERFLELEPYRTFWDHYKSFLLLVLIILSCVLNSFLDRIWTRFRHLEGRGRAPLRMIGMLYMILIFAYIKFIYEDNNYDVFISYFLGLMVGRFVYFDASFKETLQMMKQAAANIPLMLLALAYTGGMCWYGFYTGYLLKHNGVITNVFLTHLFMCVSIFVLFHFRITDKMISVAKEGKRQ